MQKKPFILRGPLFELKIKNYANAQLLDYAPFNS
jgi:hypothetical protein